MNFKVKVKSIGVKNKNDLNSQLQSNKEVIEKVIDNIEPSIHVQPVIKEKKNKPSSKKVIYVRNEATAVFSSINLCASVFGVSTSTIKYKIAHSECKRKNFDWLKGGFLMYSPD